MSQLATALVNATAISALYALVAIGFTLIFGVGGVLNLSHGALITVGAFAGYQFINVWAVDVWLGLLAVVVVSGAVGAALYLGIVRFIQHKPVTTLIVTLVLALFIEHLFRILFTSGPITIPLHGAFGGSTALVAGQSVENLMGIIFFCSWLIILGLIGFVNKTRHGMAIVATSLNDRGAELVGIGTFWVNLYTWVLAAMFAGFAGVMLAMFETGSWDMGMEPLILSFAIVMLGGLGSIKGSLVGAYVVGFLEVFTTTFVNPRLTGFAALLVLLAVLIARPQGLFGREGNAFAERSGP